MEYNHKTMVTLLYNTIYNTIQIFVYWLLFVQNKTVRPFSLGLCFHCSERWLQKNRVKCWIIWMILARSIISSSFVYCLSFFPLCRFVSHLSLKLFYKSSVLISIELLMKRIKPIHHTAICFWFETKIKQHEMKWNPAIKKDFGGSFCTCLFCVVFTIAQQFGTIQTESHQHSDFVYSLYRMRWV